LVLVHSVRKANEKKGGRGSKNSFKRRKNGGIKQERRPKGNGKERIASSKGEKKCPAGIQGEETHHHVRSLRLATIEEVDEILSGKSHSHMVLGGDTTKVGNRKAESSVTAFVPFWENGTAELEEKHESKIQKKKARGEIKGKIAQTGDQQRDSEKKKNRKTGKRGNRQLSKGVVPTGGGGKGLHRHQIGVKKKKLAS